jgi:tetratricopeptide (TPR) repeat protein
VALTLDMLSAPVGILGDPTRARALADESLAIFHELGDRNSTLYPLSKVALDEWQRGDREVAVALTEETVDLAREVNDRWWLGGRLLNLADMSWELGQLPRADELAREALALSHELGDSFHLIYLLGLLAALAAGDGDVGRAGRLWAAAEALEESGQAVFQPGERDRYRRALLALPADELETAIAEGRALTLDQAVELALAN